MTTTERPAQFTFYMTVTSTDGSVSHGTCSDTDVMRSLAKAARRGYRVEVTAQGGVNFVRDIPGKGRHSVVYEPAKSAAAHHLTPTVRNDLRLIAIRPTAEFEPETGRIKAGYVNSIPPAASSLLRFYGLIAVDGTVVTVSLSARLSMLVADHHRAPWSYEPTVAELADLAAPFVTAGRAA